MSAGFGQLSTSSITLVLSAFALSLVAGAISFALGFSKVGPWVAGLSAADSVVGVLGLLLIPAPLNYVWLVAVTVVGFFTRQVVLFRLAMRATPETIPVYTVFPVVIGAANTLEQYGFFIAAAFRIGGSSTPEGNVVVLTNPAMATVAVLQGLARSKDATVSLRSVLPGGLLVTNTSGGIRGHPGEIIQRVRGPIDTLLQRHDEALSFARGCGATILAVDPRGAGEGFLAEWKGDVAWVRSRSPLAVIPFVLGMRAGKALIPQQPDAPARLLALSAPPPS